MADKSDVILEEDRVRIRNGGQSVISIDDGSVHPDTQGFSLGTNQNMWGQLWVGGNTTIGRDVDIGGSVDIDGSLTLIGQDSSGGNALIKRIISQELSVSEGVLSSLIPDSGSKNLGSSGSPWNTLHVKDIPSQSDRRLKTDVETLDGGLEAVLNLRPVSYTWRENGSGTQLGLIAQEVANVVPEVVSDTGDDGYLGVDYTELVAVLVDAIQDQQAEKEALEDRINEQQETIETQREQIDDLEKRLEALEEER